MARTEPEGPTAVPTPADAGQWIHRLPRVPVVVKDDLLRQLVAGKTVVHAGFCGRNEGELAVPVWVHGLLAETAKEIIGVDVDDKGIEEARAAGFTAFTADCQDPQAIEALGLTADMVVAGELIEHLDRPGPFLDSMHHLADVFVITTPNAFSLINFLGLMAHREVVHPDHVALYSWYTLTNLLRRHGWSPAEVFVYKYESGTGADGDRVRPRRRRMVTGAVLAVQSVLCRYQPFFAHGLVVVCRSTGYPAAT